jgi:aspartyl-tRNA synthetase
MERYGTDKPDLRYEFPIRDWTAAVAPLGVPFFASAGQNGTRVRGITVAGGGTLSRKDVDQLADAAKQLGGPGLAWVKRQGDQVSGSVAKQFTAKAAHAFCWVVDFPLFEPDPETGRPVFAHHPFTSPHPDDVAKLDREPLACRALHYDAVYNGNELGSGSIRITDPVVQRKIFEHLGLSPADIEARFGFLIGALSAGAPPHGGFAIGFDRTTMLLAGAGSLRDVIAFPKTTAARALFEGAPSPARSADIEALHIRVVP